MDRFQDTAMCYIPQNFDKQSTYNSNLIEIKEEIPDIDFEEEKIKATTAYDDGYHSKCGEIYINNINRNFSMYCSLCNTSFVSFNLFSHHILYGSHDNKLLFINNNSSNITKNQNKEVSIKLCENKNKLSNSIQTKLSNVQPYFSTVLTPDPSFSNISNIVEASIRDLPTLTKTDNFNDKPKIELQIYKCGTCLRNFQTNQDLKTHSKICILQEKSLKSKVENKDLQKSPENIVSVATFSLAACSTPIERNECDIRKNKTFLDIYELSKSKNAKETTVNPSNSIQEQQFDSSSVLYKKSKSKCVSKTTFLNSKYAETYSNFNKYTGSTTKRATNGDGPVLKASATIAEIARGKESEDIDSIRIPKLLSGNCPYCPVKFQKMKYINFHLQKYHPEKIQQKEIKIVDSENCYKCEICNKIFRRLDFYKKHMRKHPRKRQSSIIHNITSATTENVKKNKHLIGEIENLSTASNAESNLNQCSSFDNQKLKINPDVCKNNELDKNEIKTTEPKKFRDENRKVLKCQFCGKIVFNLNHLILHERKHKIKRSVKCKICEQKFFMKSTFENHMKKSHPEVQYEFTEDEIKILSWEDPISKNSHRVYRNNKMTFKNENEKNKSCSFCPKIFKTVEYRILHEKSHSGTDNFTCKYCQQVYNSIGTLWSHQRVCGKKLKYINIELKTTQSSSERNDDSVKEIKYNRFSVESEKKNPKNCFKCSYCSKLFKRKTNWIDHVRKHTGEKFECNICDYKTASPFYLKSHMLKIHDYSKATKNITQNQEKGFSTTNLDTAIETATKTSLIKSKLLLQSLAKFDSITSQEKAESFLRLKLFKCKFCHKVYTKKQNLEDHLKTHLKSTMRSSIHLFKCKYCNLRFKAKFQVMLHERKHQKLFECNICKKMLSSKGFLSYHKKIQHKIESLIKLKSVVKCELCGKIFRQIKDLRLHINSTHKCFNINKLKCKKCEKIFLSTKLFQLHLTNEHQQSNLKNINEILTSKTNKAHKLTELNENSNDKAEKSENITKTEECKICGEIFDYNYLVTHMINHSIDEKQNREKNCTNSFDKINSMVVHNKKNKLRSNEESSTLLQIQKCNIFKKVTSTPKFILTLLNKVKRDANRALIKKIIPIINGPPFKCPYMNCIMTFRLRTAFNNHYLLHFNKLKCKYSSRSFKTNKSFQKHIKFDRKKCQYKCKACFKTFLAKQAFILHKCKNDYENTVTAKTNILYRSELCGKPFNTKLNLDQLKLKNLCEFENKEIPTVQDLSVKTESVQIITEKLRCDTCSKRFFNSDYLSMHYKKTNCISHADSFNSFDLQSKVEILKEDFLQSTHKYTINYKIPEDLKYKCKICSKGFENKMLLSWHTRRRACEVPTDFLCENKLEGSDDFENQLIKEIKINKVIKQFQNPIEVRDNQNISLSKAEDFEIKKNQYQCEVCCKIFVVKGFLLRHMKYYHPPLIEQNKIEVSDIKSITIENQNTKITETEEYLSKRASRKQIENEDTKFQCQICLKKFETKGLLAGHTRRKDCFKRSSCMSTLRAQKSLTKEKAGLKYKCNICNELFSSEIFLVNHIQNKICIFRKYNFEEDNFLDNFNNSANLPDSLNQKNADDTEIANKLLIPFAVKPIIEPSNNLEINIDVVKNFTCKKCHNKFPTKVSLAWHTRRKECYYKRKSNKVKPQFCLTKQAKNIRKKIIGRIINSKNKNVERFILQPKVDNPNVYKDEQYAKEIIESHRTSKEIININTNSLKEIDNNKEVCAEKLVNQENLVQMKKIEDNKAKDITVNYKSPSFDDANTKKTKINLGVLKNEKNLNMVRAIRNYIRDRKKGQKLPQRFYCDRYQIRKILFYRKLFKLGLVRKKGPAKQDLQNSLYEQVAKPETKILDSESSTKTSEPSSSFKEQKIKGRKGRKPKSCDEVVRKAVLDYRMGKGTQLQMCDKYQISICAFHRVKKAIQKEMPHIKFPKEEKDDNKQMTDDILLDSNSKENSNKFDNLTTSVVNVTESNNTTIISRGMKDFQHSEQYKKQIKKFKIMKTADIKKRRLEMMEACGDLIVNRKSKYNIPGTRKNTLLMDALSDIVNGVRGFSSAAKHYKISFYTLQRYLSKYKEKMTEKKNSGLYLRIKADKNINKNEIFESANENKKTNFDNELSQESQFLSASFSCNSSALNNKTKPISESDINKIANQNIYLIDRKAVSNITKSSNRQVRKVFDAATGQYIIKKKFEGRGGKGKKRQTVYSKPGTKENKILMEAINEIKNKGQSLANVAKKFQISIQTVTKYIQLFEKQGVLSQFTGIKKDKQNFQDRINSSKILISKLLKNNSSMMEKLEAKRSILKETDKSKFSCHTKTVTVNDFKLEEQKLSGKTHISNNNSKEIGISQPESFISQVEENFLQGNSTKHLDIENMTEKNSIQKKEMESIKDSIRKPTYIRQKINTDDHPISLECIKNKTFIEDHKNTKSTFEIRKPTYLTQKPLKLEFTNQTNNLINSTILNHNSINLSENKDENSLKQIPTSSIQVENVNSVIEEPQIDHKEMPEIFAEKDKRKEILKTCALTTQNSLNKPANDNNESKEKLNTSDLEHNQNIKFRKPIYITQKFNANIKNNSEILDDSTKKTLESPIFLKNDSIFELNKSKSDTAVSKIPSTIKANINTITSTIELQHQKISEILNIKTNQTDVHLEMNEDDLLIEDAMRSLLEQDIEIDLKNSLKTDNKYESKHKLLKDNSESICSNVHLETNQKSITATQNQISKFGEEYDSNENNISKN